MGKTQWHNLLVLKSDIYEGMIRKKLVIFTLDPTLMIKIMEK